MKLYKLYKRNHSVNIFSGYYASFVDCLEDAISIGIDLSEIDLKYKNLSNSNLDSAFMPHADFTGVNLTGANISEACLRGSIFQNASLYNVCFCYSDLRHCDFQKANFGGTDIAGCDISFSHFSALSCFELDFWHAEKMEGCLYFGTDGKTSSMAKRPLIIKGLINIPIILLDHEVHIGHGSFPKQNFPKLMELLDQKKLNLL